jgi:hypothetical protein
MHIYDCFDKPRAFVHSFQLSLLIYSMSIVHVADWTMCIPNPNSKKNKNRVKEGNVIFVNIYIYIILFLMNKLINCKFRLIN